MPITINPSKVEDRFKPKAAGEAVDWEENFKANEVSALKTIKARPVGGGVLLARITENIKPEDGGVIELVEQMQTTRCQVIRLGYDVPEDYGINPGDLVDVGEWNQKHQEIKLNGVYCLIVPYGDILYKVTK